MRWGRSQRPLWLALIVAVLGGGVAAHEGRPVNVQLKEREPGTFLVQWMVPRALPIHAMPGLRTNNVELAACAAPRPQLLVSVGGYWTRNTPTVDLPYLRDVYGALGPEGAVRNVHLADEQHDYGPNKRAAVVRFLARELGLDLACVTEPDGSIDESLVRLADRASLLAFTA